MLPPLLLAKVAPEVVLAAGVLLLLAGLFDFLSRSKKRKAPAPSGGQARAEYDAELPGPAPEEGPVPPPGKLPGKKKKNDAPPRPRPRRSDYTGQRVGVIVPGRQAEAKAGPPPQTGHGEKQAATDAAVCPGCKKPSDGPGRFCAECEAAKFVTEVGNLVSSLKTREVNMLPAERYLFQARSALAVSAWKDVSRLAAQAEAAAREQEADFEEGQRILSCCVETITASIEAGKNTLAAEKAFRKATLFFKQGRYTDCMEEAVLIPTLIMDRPRPRVVPAGVGGHPDGPAGSPPGTAGPGGAPPAAARIKDPDQATARCHSCGERIDRGLVTCPGCGKPTRPPGQPAWEEGRACPGCGEALDPSWRVCPACNAPVADLPADTDGSCASCGREVLPSWTICPFCDSRLKDPESAVKVRKGFSRPEKAAPAIQPALREKGVLSQIEEVDRLLDEANRRELDVRKARNLLELAVNFTRSGNYDKGERYVRKARNVAETLLSLE